jgi:hypothetical protein
MHPGDNESGKLSRQAGWRLILAALGIAAAMLAQSFLQPEGLEFTGAALIGIAALLGGWLLSAHARVPGLPLTLATIMALVVFLAGFLDSADVAVSGGTVFMALVISLVAPSRRVGLIAVAILAGAQLVAAAT